METSILHHFLCSFRWREAPGMIPGGFWTFGKILKNVKNRHFEFQKTNLGKTFRWSPGAETKTGDSSRYFLKTFLSVFLDVLKNLLEASCF